MTENAMQVVTAAVRDIEASMLTNVAAATGLPAEMVSSLLLTDDDLGALFDVVLSGAFERFDGCI